MAPGVMALIVGIKHQLEFGYHIFHALAAFLIACGCIDGKSRQIMSAHMSVQSIPVGIRRFTRLQASLLAIRGQHAVAIIFQEHLHVQVAGMLQWSVKKGDVAQRELILIKFILRHNTQGRRNAQQSNHQLFLHFLILFLFKFSIKGYISVGYSTLIINGNTQNCRSSKVGMFRISNLKTIR